MQRGLPEDRSSCASLDECHVYHFGFEWQVDLTERKISAKAALKVQFYSTGSPIDVVRLDTHESIQISSATINAGTLSWVADFRVEYYCSFGQQLVIQLPERPTGTEVVIVIEYVTSGEPAVTWLAPSQTLGNVAPMCFSMGQACLNRALFPCQDHPSVRATFVVEFTILPCSECDDVVVACAAAPVEDAYSPTTPKRRFKYEMKESLPSYLIGAFVVGRLGRKEVC